jgi:hypothetical protein
MAVSSIIELLYISIHSGFMRFAEAHEAFLRFDLQSVSWWLLYFELLLMLA